MAITLDLPDRQERGRESTIDELLHLVVVEWLSVENILNDWNELEDFEQMDFLAEWPLSESRLLELSRIATASELNRDQYLLFRHLFGLVTRYLPEVNQLFKVSGLYGKRLTVEDLGWYE